MCNAKRNNRGLFAYSIIFHAVGGGSARREVGGMEISDGEQRSACGDGEWWCGMQSPATPM